MPYHLKEQTCPFLIHYRHAYDLQHTLHHHVFNKRSYVDIPWSCFPFHVHLHDYFSLCSCASQVWPFVLITLLSRVSWSASIAFYMQCHYFFYALYFMYVYFLLYRYLWFNLCTYSSYLSLIIHVFHLTYHAYFSALHASYASISGLNSIKTHEMNKGMLLLTCYSSTCRTVISILFTNTESIMFRVFIISTTAYTCIQFC